MYFINKRNGMFDIDNTFFFSGLVSWQLVLSGSTVYILVVM